METTTPLFLGVLPDTRTPEEKESDIDHNELFASASLPNYYGSKTEASKYVDYFPLLNQIYTSSCMPHGHDLCSIIFQSLKNNVPAMAPAPMLQYRLRANYPNPGMSQPDIQLLTKNPGIAPQSALATPQQESDANNLIITQDIKNQVSIIDGSWVTINNPVSIDVIALVTNTFNLPATILFYSTEEEWSSENPSILIPNLDPNQAYVRHNVCVLPNSAYKDANGKKHVLIQDSAFFGGFHNRSVPEDFFTLNRVYGADYLINLSNSGNITKPSHKFTQPLSFGSKGMEVTALQKMLQFLGFLATEANGQPIPYGYFGGLTKNAITAFQNAHPTQILEPAGLTQGNGNFGSITLGYMNILSQ